MTINTELAKQVMVQPYYVVTKKDDVRIYLCTGKDVFNVFVKKTLQNHFRIPFKNTKLIYIYLYLCMSQRLYA